MKIEEFRIVHGKYGFVIERFTEWKEYVYTFSIFGIGIIGKKINKSGFLPIDCNNNGMPFFRLKTFSLPPFKTLDDASDYINFAINRHNQRINHREKIYYPPFK